MKSLVLFGVVVVVALVAGRPDEYYDINVEELNIDEMKDSKRLVCPFAKCMAGGDAPCTPLMSKMKEPVKDGIKTNCSKCSPKQKEVAAVLMTSMQRLCSDDWDKLLKLHDPEGKYIEDIKKFIAQYSKNN